jgi:excisionase family DNA binding protein
MEVALSPNELQEIARRVADLLHEERDDGYLNATQAAEFLGLSRQALYARVGRAQIPHKRKGKRVFFNRAELRAYMEDPTPER